MKNNARNILILTTVISLIVFTVVFYLGFRQGKDTQEARREVIELVVWTHSSFMDAYGPATELKTEFEKVCGCTVVFVDAGGAPMALEKLSMDPTRRVDVLLGLDLLILPEVVKKIRIQPLEAPIITWVDEVKPYVYPRMIPYDWSPMGFIYRASETKNLEHWSEIKNLPKKSIALQDPTLSAPGRVFLYWFYSMVGGEHFRDELVALNSVVHSYSPSWSSAYGLFRAKQAPMTFSYLTSLVYHWVHDKDMDYQFMSFSEGQPVQIEFAVVPDSCWNCQTAKEFVNFLVSPWAQKVIAEKNFMLPVNQTVYDELGENFKKLPKVKVLSPDRLDPFIKNEESLLRTWREVR